MDDEPDARPTYPHVRISIPYFSDEWPDSVGGGGRHNGLYCLKCDISKYFANIDHGILLECITKKIADPRCLRLLEEIIASSHEQIIYEDLLTVRRAGTPIGNLTSQLFANIYLNELDQFIKHVLRERWYVRYMDDFLILGYDKKELHVLKERIAGFLSDHLRLTLHPKKAAVFPADLGIDFLGYRVFISHCLLRPSTVRRFIRRTRRNERAFARGEIGKDYRDSALRSWIAYAQKGNSWRLRQKIGSEMGVVLL